MKVDQQKIGDVLRSILDDVVADKETRHRVENGNVHEGQIVEALATLVQDAGSSIECIDIQASNYPLSLRERAGGATPYPKNYRVFSRMFLQVGDRLLGLATSRPGSSRFSLHVQDHESVEAYLGGLHFGVSDHNSTSVVIDRDDIGLVTLQGVIGENKIKSLVASCVEAQLEESTPPAQSQASRGPRL